jgi:hypothetical protein
MLRDRATEAAEPDENIELYYEIADLINLKEEKCALFDQLNRFPFENIRFFQVLKMQSGRSKKSCQSTGVVIGRSS